MALAQTLSVPHGNQPQLGDRWQNADGLPLVTELRELFPHGTLRRGSSIGISGKVGHTSMLLTLLAGPVASGSWAAVVGLPALGAEAASEFGVSLDRLALIPHPGNTWLEVTAALLDAIDVVALAPPGNCRPHDAQRLLARARERQSILVLIDDQLSGQPSGRSSLSRWPQSPDVLLDITDCTWSGLGSGHGSLHHCSLSVTVGGRRLAGASRSGHIHTGHPKIDSEPDTNREPGRPIFSIAR
ncbi:MAG: hypothetical protein WCP28_17925 [Actinomycetes bacterium]